MEIIEKQVKKPQASLLNKISDKQYFYMGFLIWLKIEL